MRDAPHKTAGKRLSKFALSGAVLGASGTAGLVASGIGYRFGWWPVGTALNISEWAVYAAAFGLVASMIGAVLSRPGARQRGFVLSLLGIAASLPIVALAAQWEYAARTYPPLNDISTDTEDAPVFWDMPNPTEYPGAQTAPLQRAAYPDLAPLILSIAPERAYALAIALAKDRGWEIVADHRKTAASKLSMAASSTGSRTRSSFALRHRTAARAPTCAPARASGVSIGA